MSVYGEQAKISARMDAIQKELESCTEDMDRMTQLLDELDTLQNKAENIDLALLDKQIDIMMPELGFKPEDNDRLVASYSGGWQMRMMLGKLLLQASRLGGISCPQGPFPLSPDIRIFVAFVGPAPNSPAAAAGDRPPARPPTRLGA